MAGAGWDAEWDDEYEHVHIVPAEDLVAHEKTDNCVCGTTIELVKAHDGSDRWVYTHYSLDNRELLEK